MSFEVMTSYLPNGLKSCSKSDVFHSFGNVIWRMLSRGGTSRGNYAKLWFLSVNYAGFFLPSFPVRFMYGQSWIFIRNILEIRLLDLFYWFLAPFWKSGNVPDKNAVWEYIKINFNN